MTKLADAEESNAAFIAAWSKIYPKLPHGEYRELGGLRAIWGGVALPFANAILLSKPVRDRADMEARIETMVAYLSSKKNNPMFLVCEEWLPPEVRLIAHSLIAGAGLHPGIPLHGMAAEDVLPPVRRLPRLQFERVSDQRTRNLMCDINSLAYGFSAENGREAFCLPEFWCDGCYGYVAFLDGKPLSTAAAVALEGRLYVGFVATIPGAQRCGYGEAVMRYALEQAVRGTGLRRSILHASDAGYPLYLRMGYRPTAEFMGYVR